MFIALVTQVCSENSLLIDTKDITKKNYLYQIYFELLAKHNNKYEKLNKKHTISINMYSIKHIYTLI